MTIKRAIIETISTSEQKLEPRDLEMEVARRLCVSRRDVRRAIGELLLEHRLEYTFYGKSYVELPLPLSPRSRLMQAGA